MTAWKADLSDWSDFGISRRALLRTGSLALLLQAAIPRRAQIIGASTANGPVCEAATRNAYPPLIERFVANLDPANDDFVIEQYAAEIDSVLDGWSVALRQRNKDFHAVSGDFAVDLIAATMRASEVKPIRSAGSLHIERRFFGGPKTIGRESFLDGLKDFFLPLESVSVAEFEIFGVRTEEGPPLRVETKLRYDMVGTTSEGLREQRVGSWTITWARSDRSKWIASQFEAGPELRSRLTGPGFTDITAHCIDAASAGVTQLSHGIDHWRTVMDGACGIDVYGNHGICAGDIDGSGFDSFYVCQPAGLPNRLFQNRGDGTFTDITDHSGTGILDGTASAVFADFQNRGKQDLLVVRTGGPLLFVNLGEGRFEPRPNAFSFARPPQGTFTSAAVADYNCDGLLDVYFCVYSYYQGLNQYQFPSPYYDAQNGPPNFLFRNRGDGTFEDVTVASGMDQNNDRFSFAAAWCDYDGDGWPDLYVANDFGRKNLYRNRAGSFLDVAGQTGTDDYGPGMSVCWLDYDNDGYQDLYVANMWLKEGKRITADAHFLPTAPEAVRALYRKHNAGNSLYRNKGEGAFEDKTEEAGSAMARWSWSCASWDFDNDGYPDLYVANGFISGPNRFDLQSVFWRQVAQRSYPQSAVSADYEMAWNAINELVRSDYSWSGYERNVFYANNGDGTFSDISGVLGLDLADDSRAYALGDFDGDGRQEFVLKNRNGPQLRIFRNDLEGIGNAVSFRLRGTASNRDAIGATVTIVAGSPRQTRFVSAGSGFASQHSKELFFGVGTAAKSVSITVKWPNGTTGRYEDIPVNHRVSIEEGSKQYQSSPYRAGPKPPLRSKPLPVPDELTTVGTWLVEKLFAPGCKAKDLKGSSVDLSRSSGHPALLTFFRPNCESSDGQLQELQNGLAGLSAAGLQVFAIGLDAADRAIESRVGSLQPFTFPILLADDKVIRAWNITYRYLFDRRRDMPTPTSFLVDKEGSIICLYSGLVSPRQVITDWKSAPSTPEQRMNRALPFAGPYYGNALRRNYFTLGVAYTEYGHLDEAQAAFLRAIDASPSYSSAWFNLGTVYLAKKMYPEARKSLNETVRLNPEDSDAWNNLGKISGEEGKYDQALKEFRRAALANPNYLVPVQNMMQIYEYQGRPADAEKALEELISKTPRNADLRLGLGRALVAQQKMDRALEELEAAAQLRPDNADGLNDLGAVLLRMGRFREALSRFEESRRLAPDFDRPCINEAMVYRSLGRPEKGREVLEGFLAAHPDAVAVKETLGKMVAK